MQTNKNHVTNEIILETTLHLINEKEGIKDVTLRDIAKEIGCAHTNLYNYFSSLDDIFWETLAQVLLKMIDYADVDLDTEADPEENLYLVLSNIIDFAMDHPGWYKLMWLESLGGEPSEEVKKILTKPGKDFTNKLIKANNNRLSEEEANTIGDILHGYLRGELCKWINHRRFINSRKETKIKILSNLKCIYKLMIQ